MSKENKKAPHIMIDGKAYLMINVMNSRDELIASIGPKDVIEAKGYQVKLIEASD